MQHRPPAGPRYRPAVRDGDAWLAQRQRQRLGEFETIFLKEGFRQVTLFLRIFDRHRTRLRAQGTRGATAAPPDRAFEP
ncbi:MAG: hypothetical protein LC121_13240 [Anaerolineae bacterium]|nr:hypothetical protein [Anaerolineae bacterium]